MVNNKINIAILERRCDDIELTALNNNVFPGSVVGVRSGLGNDKKEFIKAYGKSALLPEIRNNHSGIFYDIASLTKPLATTLAVLCLCKEGKVSLSDKLGDLLSIIPVDKKTITIGNLLNHSSGLPAHKPYYKNLIGHTKSEHARDLIVRDILGEELVGKPGEKNVYSDLGFILLGYIIEKISNSCLDTVIVEKVLKPVGLENNIFFQKLDKKREDTEKKEFAPTEYCPVRHKIMYGQVHDLNAFVMGGVAGHAGLFADIEGVLRLGGIILEQWHGICQHPLIDTELLRECLKKRKDIGGSTWALGFDTPAAQGSSGGKYLSEKSIGHLGYTGTSLWIDLERQLVMVLLTNRIHPSDENIKIREFRPLFHNTVVEALYL